MANSSMRMLSVHVGLQTNPESMIANGAFEERLLQELGEDTAS